MGRLGQVQNVDDHVDDDGANVRDVQVEFQGDEITARAFEPAGVDAPPLPGDSANLEDGDGSGEQVVTGYIDTKNPRKAKPGEHRIYGRAPDGTVVSEFWLKGDGSVEISILKEGVPLTIKSPGTVIVDSPDVRLGGDGGRKVLCEGDIFIGSVAALSAAPGSPIVPNPAGTPAVPFAAQGIAASSRVRVAT